MRDKMTLQAKVFGEVVELYYLHAMNAEALRVYPRNHHQLYGPCTPTSLVNAKKLAATLIDRDPLFLMEVYNIIINKGHIQTVRDAGRILDILRKTT